MRMYVCGVTVYDHAHIGHGMSAMVFDMIRRYLEYRGYDVRHVQNFTDVDDKIINRANAEGRDPQAAGAAVHRRVSGALQSARVLPATSYPRATETMPQIIEMIGTADRARHGLRGRRRCLLPRAHRSRLWQALRAQGRRYAFRRARSSSTSARRTRSISRSGKRPSRASPPGRRPGPTGRPGWHIECSAMKLARARRRSIDIHGGGNDLIFPHHENEIAQSESAQRRAFARYWIHNGMRPARAARRCRSRSATW